MSLSDGLVLAIRLYVTHDASKPEVINMRSNTYWLSNRLPYWLRNLAV